MVKKRNLRFGYVSRFSGLAKTVLRGTVKGKEESVDRRGGKTILECGQEWTLPAQLVKLKTDLGEKGLLPIHLWCPSKLWDKIE